MQENHLDNMDFTMVTFIFPLHCLFVHYFHFSLTFSLSLSLSLSFSLLFPHFPSFLLFRERFPPTYLCLSRIPSLLPSIFLPFFLSLFFPSFLIYIYPPASSYFSRPFFLILIPSFFLPSSLPFYFMRLYLSLVPFPFFCLRPSFSFKKPKQS
ncbi:unnamed protein product [Acanthosepion pharaonis]|uniref:Uncharacterized protein n=1 Tax=Acanthosepion pharaonis TaxID=158019 RepID=A0A812EDG5_ACAPH|nr:unnamed protein product [Sepia pharaonis]